MKTTVRARLIRVCTAGIVATGLVLTAVASLGAFSISLTKGKILCDVVTVGCSSTLEEEISYVTSCLEEAEPSEDGDTTFDRVFFFGSDSSYDFKNTDKMISSLGKGEMILTPPVINESGDTVVLAALNRDDDIITGELSYDYFVAILDALRRTDGDRGFIVNSEGDLILSNTYEDTVPCVNVCDEYGFGNIVRKASEGERGCVTMKSELVGSGKAFVKYEPVSDTGYHVIYATDYNDMMEIAYRLILVMVVCMIICIVPSVIVAVKLSDRISGSIKDTAKRLEKLSTGDLKTGFSANSSGDETQVLTESMANTISALSSYVSDIDRVLSQISSGDLTASSNIEYAGDFRSIQSSLNNIGSSLRNTISVISDAGAQVLTGSASLSAGAQLLADTSSSEAATLEEINSMSADIGAKVIKNTENTIRAGRLLDDVVSDIDHGSRTMSQMSVSMEEIKSTSAEINKIVKIIEDIAFQTNILALNASVEAARAGEAGKGFAVVADEVRNLAGKTAEAAQNTMSLVSRSNEAVERGAMLTVQTDESLSAISASAAELQSLMKDISQASEEQSRAIGQINVGLSDITSAVKSNSAAAQESAASSQALKAQADKLSARVSAFRTK